MDNKGALIRSFAKNPPTVEEASLCLTALRWTEDMVVCNPEGERVWLKPLLDANGNRIGITDCCLESEPCKRHQGEEKK